MRNVTETLLSIGQIIKLYDGLLKRVCAQFGLTAIEAKIVGFLHNNPGRDTAGDIAEVRMLSKSNVSQAVESLIEKGLLRRETDKTDRRRVHLYLLPAAEPVCAAIDGMRGTFFGIVFAGFTAEETAQFEALKDRIVDNTIRARRGLEIHGGK